MNWLDVSILVVIALSALFGATRGLVREALSLGGWVLAIWVALEFSPRLSDAMLSVISIVSLRFFLSFVLLFIVTLVLAALLSNLISQKVRKSSLNGTDRALGGLFGVMRGVVVVAVLIWLAGFTKLPHQMGWERSKLASYFEQTVGWARTMVPANVGKKFGYE